LVVRVRVVGGGPGFLVFRLQQQQQQQQQQRNLFQNDIEPFTLPLRFVQTRLFRFHFQSFDVKQQRKCAVTPFLVVRVRVVGGGGGGPGFIAFVCSSSSSKTYSKTTLNRLRFHCVSSKRACFAFTFKVSTSNNNESVQ